MSAVTGVFPGAEVGRYRVIAEIGAGGMGAVYRAEVTERVAGLEVGQIVALKVVHPHLLNIPGFFKRFLREGEVGKRIRHPNVVATYDLDGIKLGDETVLYMAMEYVEGKNLWDLFQELGPIPERFARHLGRELAKGLAAIHAQGVVHRDLKPENVLIGADRTVKLMDLGVARMIEDDVRLSRTGVFVGSALYAAPEQFRDAHLGLDARVDLYALGVVLYEMTTGRTPHDADDFGGIVAKVLTEAPVRLTTIKPEVTPLFAELVHGLLVKDRDRRIGSAAEVIAILSDGEESAWWRSRPRHEPVSEAPPETRRIDVERETGLVGRDMELAELTALYERAAGGDGQVVLIEGEAGIGKTRLVDEFISRLRERGDDFSFRFGTYPPGGAATAGIAFESALEELLGESNVVDRHAAHRGVAHTSAGTAVAPSVHSPTALVQTLRSLSAERPTILLIDALQFAPPEGLWLFAAAAAAAAGRRILILGTARSGLPQAWTSALFASSHARRVALRRLGLKDAARLLIAAVESEETANELGFQVVEKSGGNPFFLLEFVRSLRDRGVLVSDPDGRPRLTRLVGDLCLPQAVEDALEARIAELSEEDREMLDVAACFGAEFDPGLLSEATRQVRISVLQRLTRLERTHRVVHAVGDRFVFDHHGLHKVLFSAIPDALRREYQASLGAALELRVDGGAEDDGDRAHLAELFLDAGDGPRALRHIAPALAQLASIHATDRAVLLVARALALPGVVSGADRFEMLLGQADRLSILARYPAERAAAAEALDLVRAHDAGPVHHARALVAVGRSLLDAALPDDARKALEEAIRLGVESREGGVEASARAVLGRLYLESGLFDQAVAEHRREAALSGKAGDALRESAAHGRLGEAFCEQGRYSTAHTCFRRERELARGVSDRLARLKMKFHSARSLFALGRYSDARWQLARALTDAQLVHSVRDQAVAHAGLGDVAIAVGDIHDARRHFSAASHLCRENEIRHLHPRVLHGIATIAEARGDNRSALESAATALGLRRGIEDRGGIVDSLILIGRIRAAIGAPVAAQTALREALDLSRKIGRTSGHVLAAAHLAVLPGGDAVAANTALRAYESRIATSDRIEAHTLLWRATGSEEHMAEARGILDRVMTYAPDGLRAAASSRVHLEADAGPGVEP